MLFTNRRNGALLSLGLAKDPPRSITRALSGATILLAVAVAGGLLTGCGSSDSGSRCDSQCQRDLSAAAGSNGGTTLATATNTATADNDNDNDNDELYADNHLTGFGAPVSTFAEQHGPENTRLAEGCCFGPMVTVNDGSSVNEWNLAGNSGGLVINLTHNFPTGTTEATALSVVTRLDLPSDTKQIKAVSKEGCRTLVYTSATLGKAAPPSELGMTVSVTLYSPPDPNVLDGPYSPNAVEYAIEDSGDDSSIDC